MNPSLFETFQSVSSKQWKQKIQFELNGQDYNQTLLWNSPENIQVKPFYHFDEHQKTIIVSGKPKTVNISQTIFVFDIQKSIKKAQDLFNKGIDCIQFTIPNSDCDVETLLTSIPIDNHTIYFDLQFFSLEFLLKIAEIEKRNNGSFFYNVDPIGHLAQDGNWYNTTENDNFETLQKMVAIFPNCNLITIKGSLYQNAGANIIQQIAYSLAHANEYLNRINPTPNLVFEMAIGSNYFFEIAKLQALRIVFDCIVKEYAPNIKCYISTYPSKRNKTLYDSQTNILRNTTECLSAILGGANTIYNTPHDAIFRKRNEFSENLALNQLLILKNEVLPNLEQNPVEGSFYIESLTQQLAEKSLILFKDIEANGGFLKQLKDGTIHRKIQESADKEQQDFYSKNKIIVGTNAFKKPSEKIKNAIELYPFSKIKPRKTLITPIIEKRLSEKLEQDRLEAES